MHHPLKACSVGGQATSSTLQACGLGFIIAASRRWRREGLAKSTVSPRSGGVCGAAIGSNPGRPSGEALPRSPAGSRPVSEPCRVASHGAGGSADAKLRAQAHFRSHRHGHAALIQLRRDHPVRTPDCSRGPRCSAVRLQHAANKFFLAGMVLHDSYSSALRFAQRWTVDGHGVAEVPQPAEQRLHHQAVTQEVRPFVIHQVRCNNCGMLAITLFHQLEENV